MRKQLTVILLSALMLSGCASGRMGNPGAIVGGAAIGGSLGSSIGGLIGDNNHGWRGGFPGFAFWDIFGDNFPSLLYTSPPPGERKISYALFFF